MGLMRFNFRSQVLSGYVDVTVAYPTDFLSYYDMSTPRHHVMPGQPKYPMYRQGMKFQTVYLLHGGGDDDSLCYRYTNAELYAQKNYVMLVTPDIMNSFGIDTAFGFDYSTFLTEELPVVIQTLFASSPKREDNFIMGYAMGGNAALGNALKRPDLYTHCVDISGGIGMSMDTEGLKRSVANSSHFKIVGTSFGDPDKIDGSDLDLPYLAKRNIERGDALPDFTFIAGSEEGGIGNRVKNDYEALTALGHYNTQYICKEGYPHYFPLWDEAIRMSLDEILPLRRAPIYPEE